MAGMVTRRRRSIIRGSSAAAGAFGFERADEISWGFGGGHAAGGVEVGYDRGYTLG